MRCLHCGKRLPILRKLVDGEFCSDQHRKRFQDEQEELALARLLESGERLAGVGAKCPLPADAAFLRIQTPFVHIRPGARGMRTWIKYRLATLSQAPAIILPSGLQPEASLLNPFSFLLWAPDPHPWGTDEPWRTELTAMAFDGLPVIPRRRLRAGCGLAITPAITAGLIVPAEGLSPWRSDLLGAVSISPFLPVSGLSTLPSQLRAHPEIPKASSFLATSIGLLGPAVPPIAVSSAAELVLSPALAVPVTLAVSASPALSLGPLVGLMADYRQLPAHTAGIPALPAGMRPAFPSMPICPEELALRQAGPCAAEPAALGGAAVRAETSQPLLYQELEVRYPTAPARPACGEPTPAPDLLAPQLQPAAAVPPVLSAHSLQALPGAPPLLIEPAGECRQAESTAPDSSRSETIPDPIEEPLGLREPLPARGEEAPLAAGIARIEASLDLGYPSVGGCAAAGEELPSTVEASLALTAPGAARGCDAPLPAEGTLLQADVAVWYPARLGPLARVEPALNSGLFPEPPGEPVCSADLRQAGLEPLPLRRRAECLPGGPDPILSFEAPGAASETARFEPADPETAAPVPMPLFDPRSRTIRLAARLRPEPPWEAPYAPTLPPEHLPCQPVLPAALPIDLDVPTAPWSNAVPFCNVEFSWPISETVRPALRLALVPPSTASPEAGLQPQPTQGSTVQFGWRPLVHFWKHAPADLRWISLVLPVVLLLGLSHGVHKVKVESHGESGVGAMVKARFEDVRQTIIRRAAIELQDDFHSGLSNWEGKGQWAREWKYDEHGSVHPGSLALFQPSIALTDYQFEFLGQIQSRSIGWVYRANDTANYYAAKIVLTKPGPLPSAAIVRYAVIGGKEGPKKSTPLPFQVRPDMMYRVRVDVSGPNFTTWVQGQLVDFWSDDRLKSGGIGFFSNKGEGALLRWVEVSHQYDTLGRLCAFLAPYSVPTRDGSLNP